jgi:hypothetical protein
MIGRDAGASLRPSQEMIHQDGAAMRRRDEVPLRLRKDGILDASDDEGVRGV